MNKVIPALLTTIFLFGCQENTPEKEAENEKQPQKVAPTSEQATSLPIQNKDGQKLEYTDIKTLKQSLEKLVSDKHCDDSSQCKAIAVGHRACGGPSSYIVYSTQSVDEAHVAELADKITGLERAYNMQNQMMSICEHLVEPATQCVENKCVKLDSNRSAY
ncbi:hypothetical protein [Pseudoalteromonas piscicida]|uniref:hypothetical protein n=1 Tax=Pseudoalteromonas piscicida TaxID=43662 RepID=UPI00309C9560